jgi:hypothetical protein
VATTCSRALSTCCSRRTRRQRSPEGRTGPASAVGVMVNGILYCPWVGVSVWVMNNLLKLDNLLLQPDTLCRQCLLLLHHCSLLRLKRYLKRRKTVRSAPHEPQNTTTTNPESTFSELRSVSDFILSLRLISATCTKLLQHTSTSHLRSSSRLSSTSCTWFLGRVR